MTIDKERLSLITKIEKCSICGEEHYYFSANLGLGSCISENRCKNEPNINWEEFKQGVNRPSGF